ncbi:hypothetical protein Salat_1912300 [Sesamum alatum]|uniref:Uncharacterized protein n=1 Tax=Sesamum alatum TaxID=300844 RepID=A0AAE1Y3V5_9LAMI|nr:hypothetical protein Salat_1912300 [Sesamum alatum]
MVEGENEVAAAVGRAENEVDTAAGEGHPVVEGDTVGEGVIWVMVRRTILWIVTMNEGLKMWEELKMREGLKRKEGLRRRLLRILVILERAVMMKSIILIFWAATGGEARNEGGNDIGQQTAGTREVGEIAFAYMSEMEQVATDVIREQPTILPPLQVPSDEEQYPEACATQEEMQHQTSAGQFTCEAHPCTNN